jgi:uncharacterized HAD superfamily protein
MEKCMNIGIDIDDTISDTYEYLAGGIYKYSKEVLKRDIEPNYSENHAYYNLPAVWNMSKEEDEYFWDNYYIDIIKKVKPKKDVVQIIKKIKEKGHNIILITARIEDKKEDITEVTKNWLNENGIIFDKLIVNVNDKLEMAKKENISIFIDDNIRNCSMVASSGYIKTYMFTTVANKHYENENIKRVNSWKEIYDEIKDII